METRILAFFAIIVICAWSIPAHVQSADLDLHPTGDAIYEIRGAGLVKVGGIDATLEYDAGTFANPRVTAGRLAKGAMFLANTNKPGALRFAILQTARKGISGSGTVATIAFDRLGSSPSREMNLRVTAADVKGAKIAVKTTIRKKRGFSGSPALSINPPSNIPSSTTSKVSSEGTESRLVAGENSTAEQNIDVNDSSASQPPEKPLERKSVVHPSVLDRFNTLSDHKTPAALVALFTKQSTIGFSQEPKVALSDGISHIIVRIGPELTGTETPVFGLNGATLVSMLLDKDGNYRLEILPEKGVNGASLEVLLQETIINIPLTIARPLPSQPNRGDTLTEADFRRYLDEQAKTEQKVDGKAAQERSTDLYMITANYLVQAGKKDALKAQDSGRMHRKDVSTKLK